MTSLTTENIFSGVMATQERVMQVSRASVIPRKPDDWSKWLFAKKISTEPSSLWNNVNPDLTAETLKKLEVEKPKSSK